MVDIVRMTVIPEDFVVQINGDPRTVLDMSSAPANLHAMQWYETWGEEEFDHLPGEPKPPNQVINNLDNYQTLISLWEAAAPVVPPPVVPTPLQLSMQTMADAQGWLSYATLFQVPGVLSALRPNDQTAVSDWIAAVIVIAQTAQAVIVNQTGEAYSPGFPPAPTLIPDSDDRFFLVEFA